VGLTGDLDVLGEKEKNALPASNDSCQDLAISCVPCCGLVVVLHFLFFIFRKDIPFCCYKWLINGVPSNTSLFLSCFGTTALLGPRAPCCLCF